MPAEWAFLDMAARAMVLVERAGLPPLWGRLMSRFMTVVLINGSCARVVFRGSLGDCQRVAGDYLTETFVLPARF